MPTESGRGPPLTSGRGRPLRIRTITVDFWGTLLSDPPVSDDRYRRPRLSSFERILRAAGVPASVSALERGYQESGWFLQNVWTAHRDVPVEEHVRAILRSLDAKLPARLDERVMAELVEAYARPALLAPPAVDAGALRALTTLCERGYTLAVVSNSMRTPGRTLRRILEHYGLLSCFAHTTFSDEVGVRKPSPQIFAVTLRAVGGEPSSAVHVGDDPVLDVEGARAAGMRAIQVGGEPDQETDTATDARPVAPPDATIASLSGLPEAIARLEQV